MFFALKCLPIFTNAILTIICLVLKVIGSYSKYSTNIISVIGVVQIIIILLTPIYFLFFAKYRKMLFHEYIIDILLVVFNIFFYVMIFYRSGDSLGKSIILWLLLISVIFITLTYVICFTTRSIKKRSNDSEHKNKL